MALVRFNSRAPPIPDRSLRVGPPLQQGISPGDSIRQAQGPRVRQALAQPQRRQRTRAHSESHIHEVCQQRRRL